MTDPYASPPPGAATSEERQWRPRDLPWTRRALAVGPLAAIALVLLLTVAWSLLGLLLDRLVTSAVEREGFLDDVHVVERGPLERAAPFLAVLLVATLAALAKYAVVRLQRRLGVGPEGLLPWAALGLVLGVAGGFYVAAVARWTVEEVVYLVVDGDVLGGRAPVPRPGGRAAQG